MLSADDTVCENASRCRDCSSQGASSGTLHRKVVTEGLPLNATGTSLTCSRESPLESPDSKVHLSVIRRWSHHAKATREVAKLRIEPTWYRKPYLTLGPNNTTVSKSSPSACRHSPPFCHGQALWLCFGSRIV